MGDVKMEKAKTSQLIMVWLLPLIVIGGLFIPRLGYLVFFMMVFFLILSYFRGRYWCTNLCPRGSFLDLVLSRISFRRRIPRFLVRKEVRWTIFAIFMAFFVYQFVTVEKTVPAVGFVFVRICLLTTLIAIFLGVPIHQRVWCSFCPMGTLQRFLGGLKRKQEAQNSTA